ncbi:hypothetical protein GCM10011579_076600 [Streptomyces albiflavescens]|uniref:Uncharacterized protein n=1 Tax=Streptomyces albiflavescens TaxID=1623582 RepID=A0A917YCG6_9ACTN|nr:hypothetical protein GCM10011579_076600 [Streptomyces albiflavescens]
MARGLRFGEHGGQGIPGSVVEDAFGVLGNRLLDVVGIAALGLRPWCPDGEGG